MIMQGQICRTALIGLCFLLSACEARPAPEKRGSASDDEPAPALAAPDPALEDVAQIQPDPESKSEPATPELAPARTSPPAPKRDDVPTITLFEPSEPPVEVEGLVIIGPRDGETLGEYRARADEVFRRLDIDGDGRLDREEITAGAVRLPFRTALEQGDANLDQFVSRQEFDDMVTRAFQRLDADGNGVITDLELEAAADPLAH